MFILSVINGTATAQSMDRNRIEFVAVNSTRKHTNSSSQSNISSTASNNTDCVGANAFSSTSNYNVIAARSRLAINYFFDISIQQKTLKQKPDSFAFAGNLFPHCFSQCSLSLFRYLSAASSLCHSLLIEIIIYCTRKGRISIM